VKKISFIMEKTMKTSGAETLSVSANIFVGQTEAPILIGPFISSMTKSELMAIMVGGFSTAAGSVMALYVSWLTEIPNIAGHLLAASVMSAPAALMVAKIIYPETQSTKSINSLTINENSESTNVMDAIGKGATNGMKLAANVAAMLIAFISIVAMLNFFLGYIGTSLEDTLGLLFRPIAWSMGIPWNEAVIAGELLGLKTTLNEFVAYPALASLEDGVMSDRSKLITFYSLCGFANFSSVGILISGIGAMAPERKDDLINVSFKALVAATLASCMTGLVVGCFI